MSGNSECCSLNYTAVVEVSYIHSPNLSVIIEKAVFSITMNTTLHNNNYLKCTSGY